MMRTIKPEKSKNRNNNKTEDKNLMEQHLSNERTFLSWTRTGLNIFTIGCAIGRFGGTSNTSTTLTDPDSQKKPLISGIILAFAGILCLIYGVWRFVRNHRHIKHGTSSYSPDIFGPIISILVLMAALIAIIIIFFIV